MLPLCAAGMPAALLDAPGTGPPPTPAPVVPAVVLDGVASTCRCGVVVSTTAVTTPTTVTTATTDQTLRCVNNPRLRRLLTCRLPVTAGRDSDWR